RCAGRLRPACPASPPCEKKLCNFPREDPRPYRELSQSVTARKRGRPYPRLFRDKPRRLRPLVSSLVAKPLAGRRPTAVDLRSYRLSGRSQEDLLWARADLLTARLLSPSFQSHNPLSAAFPLPYDEIRTANANAELRTPR